MLSVVLQDFCVRYTRKLVSLRKECPRSGAGERHLLEIGRGREGGRGEGGGTVLSPTRAKTEN